MSKIFFDLKTVITLLLFAGFSISEEGSQHEIQTTYPLKINESPCPPEHEKTRELLNRFLTSEGAREQQQRRELQTRKVQAADIVLLAEENDEEACRQIRKKFPWKKQRETLIRTYYKTDQYYFIVNYAIEDTAREKPENGIQFSGQFIVQLDKEFNHMGAAVMHFDESQ